MTVGKATILGKKKGGWLEVFVTDDEGCIACHRMFSGRFNLRPSRLDPNMFDNVTCPRCGAKNYARVST